MRAWTALGALLVASPALAAVQSYDAVCQATCVASDGTSQAAGVVLYRFAWDGASPFVPQDVRGNAMTATLDAAQSAALYQPVLPVQPALTFATSQAPVASVSYNSTGSVQTVTKTDGTSTSPMVPLASTVSAISGSITQAGRTTSPVTLNYSAVAVGGTPATMVAMDSKSGAANVGDQCAVASATATPMPSTMRYQCDITAPGVATITAFPTLGLALGAQSVSVNVFWRG